MDGQELVFTKKIYAEPFLTAPPAKPKMGWNRGLLAITVHAAIDADIVDHFCRGRVDDQQSRSHVAGDLETLAAFTARRALLPVLSKTARVGQSPKGVESRNRVTSNWSIGSSTLDGL